MAQLDADDPERRAATAGSPPRLRSRSLPRSVESLAPYPASSTIVSTATSWLMDGELTDEVLRKMLREHLVHRDGCRLWTGEVDERGVGVFRWRHHTWAPHRLAWKLQRGEVPARLRNTCGQKTCVV